MSDNYIRAATLVRVIDGDTVDLDIDLGWAHRFVERCRLVGLDTPEIRGPERPLGLEYRQLVLSWFLENGGECWIESREFDRGKYGRTLATIWDPEMSVSLNDLLEDQMRHDGLL